MVPACERHGLGILPYFPLARGLLTGKYRRGEAGPAGARLSSRDEIADARTFDALESLERYAEERGIRCSRWPSAGSPHNAPWRP